MLLRGGSADALHDSYLLIRVSGHREAVPWCCWLGKKAIQLWGEREKCQRTKRSPKRNSVIVPDKSPNLSRQRALQGAVRDLTLFSNSGIQDSAGPLAGKGCRQSSLAPPVSASLHWYCCRHGHLVRALQSSLPVPCIPPVDFKQDSKAPALPVSRPLCLPQTLLQEGWLGESLPHRRTAPRQEGFVFMLAVEGACPVWASLPAEFTRAG